MEDNILRELGTEDLRIITFEYDNKTPNETNSGYINCGDKSAPSVLFPFNAQYSVNLFFIEIGGTLNATYRVFRILKYLWTQKIFEEGINGQDTALLFYSPITEEEQPCEDIRFKNIGTINASRDVFRDSYSDIVYKVLDRIISMINRPDHAERILVGMPRQERIGIVFLISSELSKHLIEYYPFPNVIQGHDNTIMHANVISVKVAESSIQSLWALTRKICKEIDSINQVYYSKEESAISLAPIQNDKKEKRNKDESLLRD